MKWRRTIILWFALFVPLSIYNVFGSPIFFPTQSTQHQDPRIQHYNFSMASPIYLVGNFSASFALGNSPTYYRLSARVDVSVDYGSHGAYGAFPLIVSVAENGFYHSPNKQRMDFVENPPIPPTGDRLALNGQLPDTTVHEEFNHLIQGTNTIFLNFTFFSTGINSTSYTPPNYGPGYFKLNIGPFVVDVTDLTTVYSLDAVSELILAGILFPVAHGIRILIRKLQE